MKKIIFLSILLLSFNCLCFATPVQWTVESGGNGHWYEVINDNSITWIDAKTESENSTFLGVNGHLATITSQSENDFIMNTLLGTPTSNKQFYLGGFQLATGNEPDQLWTWITGELWNYTNWDTILSIEPNNGPHGSEEDALEIYWRTDAANGNWNDLPTTITYTREGGYIIEYVPEPATLLLLGLGGLVLRKRK